MYEVIAKLDKQHRITIPEVVRQLVGLQEGDVVKVIVVEKVEPKMRIGKSETQSPQIATLEPIPA